MKICPELSREARLLNNDTSWKKKLFSFYTYLHITNFNIHTPERLCKSSIVGNSAGLRKVSLSLLNFVAFDACTL